MSKRTLTDWIGYVCVKIYKPFSRKTLNDFLDQEVDGISCTQSKYRVLNIGAGGDVYQRLKKNPCFDIEQLDIDSERKPDILSDASDMNMISDSVYDFVFAIEVLEHIPTPQKAIDEIFRVLKKDGKFIFTTPFLFPIHDEPHDYFRYTKYGLKYLLRAFDLEMLNPRNSYIPCVVLLMMRTIVIGNKRQRVGAFFAYCLTLLSYPFWILLSKLFDSELATTGYCGVARKRD